VCMGVTDVQPSYLCELCQPRYVSSVSRTNSYADCDTNIAVLSFSLTNHHMLVEWLK